MTSVFSSPEVESSITFDMKPRRSKLKYGPFTINFLVNRLRNSGPKSVAVATALFKKEVAKLDFEVDYVGFEIPPEFVVGYGLDYDEKYRQLKDVMVMEPEDIN